MLYFGTLAIIGLSTPENHYNSFVANYLNFISPLRSSLLHGAKVFLSVLGYSTDLVDDYTLAMPGESGIRMVYSCIGYGVMSFWVAFIIANKGNWRKKTAWVVGGLVALWFINIMRLALLLLTINKGWSIPFGWDHHTWFNIFAYLLIFTMIFFYDKSIKKNHTLPANNTANQNSQFLL